MYLFWRRVRIFLTLLFVVGVVTAIGFAIAIQSETATSDLYNRQMTAAIETAIADALLNATRTAEAPLGRYMLLRIEADESLEAVAARYGTTVEIIRMVNGLAADVENGSGVNLIIPMNVTELDPPRTLRIHRARLNETLASLAQQFDIPLSMLETDNPILSARGIIPGDVVFIAQFFS